jgi:hypothetical protein
MPGAAVSRRYDMQRPPRDYRQDQHARVGRVLRIVSNYLTRHQGHAYLIGADGACEHAQNGMAAEIDGVAIRFVAV